MDNGISMILLFGIVVLIIFIVISILSLFNVLKKKKENSTQSIFLNLFAVFSLGALLFILLCALVLGMLCG